MGGFDAVGYLRQVGETDPGDRKRWLPFAGPLDHAAAALVAVDAIAAKDAEDVLTEFGRDPVQDRRADRDPRDPGLRVASLNADVRLLSGVLRLSHARFDERDTALMAGYRADPEHAGRHRDWIRVASGWPSGLSPLHVSDDRGTMVPLTFHGSGNDDRWQATLRTKMPIAKDTAWIELDGTRVPCVDKRPEVRVGIEPTQGGDRAHAHLWRCLARCDSPVDRGIPSGTIDALIASGALHAADPVLRQVEAVRRRLPHRHGGQTASRGFRALPDPWPSLIQRRGRADGLTGLVLIAAAVPPFSGHRIAIDVLESGAERFTVAVRESPVPRPGPQFRGPVRDRDLIWWARDDRGNSYLAARDDRRVVFTTPLDPLAGTLELMPSAVEDRAVISFPLLWDGN